MRPRIGKAVRKTRPVRAIAVFAVTLFVGGCSSADEPTGASDPPTVSMAREAPLPPVSSTTSTRSETLPTAAPSTGISAIDLCVGAVHESGPVVADERLTEISGIAFSRSNPTVLYAHNDSGDVARVFALADDGTTSDVFTAEAVALDWEDASTTADAVFVADIGDNLGIRPSVRIVRVDEVTRVNTTYPITYMGGRPDAEALIVEETGSVATIITKDRPDNRARIFEVRLDPAAAVNEAVERGALAVGGVVSAADLSADGSVIAVRTYDTIWLFDRVPGQSVADALMLAPCEAPSVPEVQGESIAIHIDGRGYTTISEGLNPTRNDFRLP